MSQFCPMSVARAHDRTTVVVGSLARGGCGATWLPWSGFVLSGSSKELDGREALERRPVDVCVERE